MNTTLMTSPSTGAHRTWDRAQLQGTGTSAPAFPVNGLLPMTGAELAGFVTGPVRGYVGNSDLSNDGTALIAQDRKTQDVRDPLPPRDRLL